MVTTRFTELVGCTIPIQQAGMGALSPPELAAAVSEAGALGMVGTARPGLNVVTLSRLLDWMDEHTTRPYGVNFIVDEKRAPTDRRCIELAASRAKVVDFFYGDPDPDLIKIVHDAGALADWQVGSREEALQACEVGCDFIVAQGIQAGGHVRGTKDTHALVAEVIASVDVPVLAAGGIGTGQQIAALLAAGVDGARLGTRFLAANEAGTHPIYLAALISACAEDTVYTGAFSIGWPDAPHRVLRSSLAAVERLTNDEIGERQSLDGSRVPIRRFQSVSADATTTGYVEAMSLWAGTSVDSIQRLQPTAEIIRELTSQAGWLEQDY